ncbi:Zn-ribbon domain-containing OB-fold protein [Conexibacter sp. CPCC 206217]|uniref:Zn-ribbon domain-containing OB-fold protein n=1 Tax=Conexibacter sp. CPCC 206217 TaxID=3064574 RepID=UPI0027282232|nr:OB-fold domain-containing protein [Conexibacter sp. CPCC 206217]MDO8212210.1 OB-fold domain-containing protein [Conexibacter sp. CPCC 206217]
MTARPVPPLPDVDDALAAPFWAAARERRLALQRCGACGYVAWPPARVCPDCLAQRLRWEAVAQTGEIWSFAVYHRALHPAFAAAVPYAVLAVTLDAGPLMIGAAVDAIDRLAVGARVRVRFEDVAARVTLVRFALDDGTAPGAPR